jgi:predicted adenine nucleotide alpha hydrolase (AANH) superfamily ATPase
LVRENYQQWLDHEILLLQQEQRVPRLLLHSCCAPCSSYVLEYLSRWFRITVYYFNPNITKEEEYRHRVAEQQRLIRTMQFLHPVDFLEGDYRPTDFFAMAKGMEQLPEGGERCFACYRMRLESTAQQAQKGGFDYFTTTLSVSPYKNAQKLNEIGRKLSQQVGVSYLCSDFKKRNGYKRSVELSEKYGLYRQNYCGCVFSLEEARRRTAEKGRSTDQMRREGVDD